MRITGKSVCLVQKSHSRRTFFPAIISDKFTINICLRCQNFMITWLSEYCSNRNCMNIVVISCLAPMIKRGWRVLFVSTAIGLVQALKHCEHGFLDSYIDNMIYHVHIVQENFVNLFNWFISICTTTSRHL